ncbi:potassium-transporting ATPase subunit KdpC [Paenibacillus provencensis]|uniref:Potassium-transporting ATPase KdpC subunit n=1 Tax=Paenibacillus provencensis TaxID=441151 RepID=A0ABW3PUN6_9BACL|nr:potassium-transporting ATPase subunit KdpC [Paenibacillus sp. MER 78]MCM3129311.1 potassium-transporting ATPase subunit KdpC [Paenibacillus sp. MER 78]
MQVWTISLRVSLALMLLLGLGYNLLVTGIAQLIMPHQADGSLIYDEQQEPIGSELIGQNFTAPAFFHGRISSIEYNAAGSGSGNYAPSNPDMLARTEAFIQKWQTENPEVPISQLPADLVTNSGSGLDPHISPEAARVQIPRISAETGISEEELAQMVEQHTTGRQFGFLGEPVVSVLELNLELQSKPSYQ